ncbi:MAG TPA: TlpA disulfide reductase family protein [Longimicrobium sp.]|nr:TlpA disulfide reductase family protein [Longimicrobium sp.]
MKTSCVAFAAFLLAACHAPPRAGAVVGAEAPAFEAVALEGGKPVSLRDLRGRAVLLNVWATWCHPCRKEIPELQKLHVAMAARGLTVVGVSVDEPGQAGEIPTFLRGFGATYAVWLDPADRAASTFATVGVPTTLLIGRDGTILWRHVGPVRADDPALLRLLNQALDAPAS